MSSDAASQHAAGSGARRLRAALQRLVAIAVPAVVLAVLALFGTAGHFDRRRDADEPYALLLEIAFARPLEAIGVFAAFAAVYTALFLGVLAIVRRWSRAAVPGTDASRAVVTARRAMAWLYARWWRISLVLMIAWSPLFLMQFPGTSNPDFHLAVVEVLGDRADMDYPPFDVYPIAHHLIPNDEVLLSTHHNAFLTWTYGTLMGTSMDLTGTFRWAFVLLTASQAAFTLLAFGRAMQLVARHVPGTSFRLLAIVVAVVCGHPVAMWSIALAKNPLFAAALLWWLAVCIDVVCSGRKTPLIRVVGWGALTFILINSAKYGEYIVLAQLVVLLIVRRGKRPWAEALTALAIPVLVFEALLRALIGGGHIIPDDPMAAKALQIQSLGLILQQNPDALTNEERERLGPAFDPEVMSQEFDPDFLRPMRGSGYRDGAYRWRTVTEEQAAEFDAVWASAAAREPGLVADSVILGAFRFFDPLSRGFDNWPRVDADDGIQALPIGGHHFGDDGRNDAARAALTDLSHEVASTPGARLLLESSVRAALVVLLAAVAIALRRRAAWIWAVPLALHCGVLIAAPLAASGRYALGITYALPLAILALGIAPTRPDPARGEAPRRAERQRET